MPSSRRAVANSSAASPSIWCPPYVMKLKTNPSFPSSIRELAHLVVAQSGRIPVERRRQVVGEHLVRVLVVDRLGESLSVLEVGGLRLHPQQVGERRGSEGLGDGVVDPAPDLVVALGCLRELRIPDHVDAERIRAAHGLRRRRRGAQTCAIPRWSCRPARPRRRDVRGTPRRPRRTSSGRLPPARSRRTGSRSRRAGCRARTRPAPASRIWAPLLDKRQEPDSRRATRRPAGTPRRTPRTAGGLGPRPAPGRGATSGSPGSRPGSSAGRCWSPRG